MPGLLGLMTPEPGVPRWLLAWVGGVFVLAGGVLDVRAVQRVLWKQRSRRYVEPWRRDYPWPLDYMPDDSARSLRYHAGGLLFMAAFIVIFNCRRMAPQPACPRFPPATGSWSRRRSSQAWTTKASSWCRCTGRRSTA